MQDLTGKITGGTLTAAEWNQLPGELQNVIVDFAVLAGAGNIEQLGDAIASYVAAGDFYSESGIADAYVLDKIGAKRGLLLLAAITDGATARFRPGNANTGASTVNVNTLGVKTIVREDGTALLAADLATTRDASIRWDQGNDRWVLAQGSLATPPPDGAHLIAHGVQATTSGTAFDFGSIPSWVKRITLILDQVSVDAGDEFLVQIGDAGGLEVTGYDSASVAEGGATNASSTTGFVMLNFNGASVDTHGRMVIERINPSTNVWVASHQIMDGPASTANGTGRKALSATLDRVRLTRTGAANFDAGQINLFYE